MGEVSNNTLSIQSWALVNRPSAGFISKLTNDERRVLCQAIHNTPTACEDKVAIDRLMAKMKQPENVGKGQLILVELFNMVFRPEASIKGVVRAIEKFQTEKQVNCPPKVNAAIDHLKDACQQNETSDKKKLVIKALEELYANKDELTPEAKEFLIANLESAARVFRGDKDLANPESAVQVFQSDKDLSKRLKNIAKLLRVGVPTNGLKNLLGNKNAHHLLFEERLIDRLISFGQPLTLNRGGEPVFKAPFKINAISNEKIKTEKDKLQKGSKDGKVKIATIDSQNKRIKTLEVEIKDLTDEQVKQHIACTEIEAKFGNFIARTIPIERMTFKEENCSVTLGLTVDQLGTLGIIDSKGNLEQPPYDYFQKGFVEHDNSGWSELKPYMTLPRDQWPDKPTVEIVASFATTAGPAAVNGHTYVRLIDTDGKVYSMGITIANDVEGMGATNKVWLKSPDDHSFMPSSAREQYVSRYELSKEGFAEVKQRIQEHQFHYNGEEGSQERTYQRYSNNCVAFTEDIQVAVLKNGGERVALPASYPQLTPFEARCLRTKVLCCAVFINAFSRALVPLALMLEKKPLSNEKETPVKKLSVEQLAQSELNAQTNEKKAAVKKFSVRQLAQSELNAQRGSVANQIRDKVFKVNLPGQIVTAMPSSRRRWSTPLSETTHEPPATRTETPSLATQAPASSLNVKSKEKTILAGSQAPPPTNITPSNLKPTNSARSDPTPSTNMNSKFDLLGKLQLRLNENFVKKNNNQLAQINFNYDMAEQQKIIEELTSEKYLKGCTEEDFEKIKEYVKNANQIREKLDSDNYFMPVFLRNANKNIKKYEKELQNQNA